MKIYRQMRYGGELVVKEDRNDVDVQCHSNSSKMTDEFDSRRLLSYCRLAAYWIGRRDS